MATTPPFKYQPMFEKGKDTTEYYLLTKDYVSVSEFEGKPILKIEKEGLTAMANAAFRDVSFMLRRSHNEQVAKILSDPEASDNDKYVALTFLRNAEVASKGVLPFCQDTGTAIIHGEKDNKCGRAIVMKKPSRSVSIKHIRKRICVILRTPLSICTTK